MDAAPDPTYETNESTPPPPLGMPPAMPKGHTLDDKPILVIHDCYDTSLLVDP